ncbi:hypothetical protein ROZALSC1DRAFT_26489 [Rozella allomycis CSF55]|uniref:Uncharacterized protein n=1 Tax=Rozella allomycis (strain CSF55) TaxID=988480 RepID=A0A4P9YQM2_ROZAC|nr:hypothetical protein ROZALSC1DRAFT_26489 [Rozella allomycis CSF55]
MRGMIYRQNNGDILSHTEVGHYKGKHDSKLSINESHPSTLTEPIIALNQNNASLNARISISRESTQKDFEIMISSLKNSIDDLKNSISDMEGKVTEISTHQNQLAQLSQRDDILLRDEILSFVNQEISTIKHQISSERLDYFSTIKTHEAKCNKLETKLITFESRFDEFLTKLEFINSQVENQKFSSTLLTENLKKDILNSKEFLGIITANVVKECKDLAHQIQSELEIHFQQYDYKIKEFEHDFGFQIQNEIIKIMNTEIPRQIHNLVNQVMKDSTRNHNDMISADIISFIDSFQTFMKDYQRDKLQLKRLMDQSVAENYQEIMGLINDLRKEIQNLRSSSASMASSAKY